MPEVEHRTTSRVLDIIELLCDCRKGMTFTEISRAMKMPKSSLHPLLMTLCKRRYVKYSKDNQKYYMGEKLFILGSRYVDDTDLLELIRHEMVKLSDKTGESVFFGVLSGSDVVYLLKSESKATNIRLVSNLGFKWGAYGTGFGKALLSQYNKEQLKELYPNGLKPITPYTITSIDELDRQCEQTRQTGFAYEKQESTLEVQCIATPIKDEGVYLAGISIAVPIFRYSKEKEDLFKKEIIITKQKIEKIISQNRSNWIYS